MKIDILELLHRAYVAGFSRSAEGYNGEYPFDGDNNAIAREVRGYANISIEAILGSIPIDATPTLSAAMELPEVQELFGLCKYLTGENTDHLRIAIAGNPNVIAEMQARAHAALAPFTKAKP